MKRFTIILSSALFALFFVFASASSSLAASPSDRTIRKARAAVQEASPSDWHTLAESARKCIEKGVNLREAFLWLDQSLAIKETAYNLEIKGDYYAVSQIPEQAVIFYGKSIRVGKLAQPNYMNAKTQAKILAMIHQTK